MHIWSLTLNVKYFLGYYGYQNSKGWFFNNFYTHTTFKNYLCFMVAGNMGNYFMKIWCPSEFKTIKRGFERFVIYKYRVFQKSRPSLTHYIFRYENSIAIKKVCLDRETLHNFCDTKHDPIDDLVTYLSILKWISSKYTKTYLKDPYLYF